MRSLMLISFLAAGAAGAAGGTLGAQQPVPGSVVPPGPSVVVTAQGEARVTPDRATVHIGVETRAATAAAASRENAQKQRAVIDTLRALGIPNELIGTAEFSVYPERVFNPERGDKVPRVTGYVVRNTVRVEVRKLDLLGALLDAVIAKGANGINSLDFFASNADQARRAALAMAVGRARADAEAIATAAGRCLSEAYELSSVQMQGPMFREQLQYARVAAAAGAVETPVNPGEQTVMANVTGRWILGPVGTACR